MVYCHLLLDRGFDDVGRSFVRDSLDHDPAVLEMCEADGSLRGSAQKFTFFYGFNINFSIYKSVLADTVFYSYEH